MSAISSAYSELSKSHLEYVKFYMDNHTSLPTWIMIKVINFSTYIDILRNSKNRVKHSICRLYDMIDATGHYDVKLLIGSLHWLRKVRNSCAHNERIYCIKQSQDRNGILERYFRTLRPAYLRDSDKRIGVFCFISSLVEKIMYINLVIRLCLLLLRGRHNLLNYALICLVDKRTTI